MHHLHNYPQDITFQQIKTLIFVDFTTCIFYFDDNTGQIIFEAGFLLLILTKIALFFSPTFSLRLFFPPEITCTEYADILPFTTIFPSLLRHSPPLFTLYFLFSLSA